MELIECSETSAYCNFNQTPRKYTKEYIHSDCSNYRGISLLPITYKILSNILLSRLTPYAEEITGDHQCGFRRNRSATDHVLCVRPVLWEAWECNEVVNQIFIDFMYAPCIINIQIFYCPAYAQLKTFRYNEITKYFKLPQHVSDHRGSIIREPYTVVD